MSRRQIILRNEDDPMTLSTSMTMTSNMTLSALRLMVGNKFSIKSDIYFQVEGSQAGQFRPVTTDVDVSKICHGDVVAFSTRSHTSSCPDKSILSTSSAEKVNIEPHYETLTSSGLYAYYDSSGYRSLNFAIGELIDNALSATMKNEARERRIEVRLYKDTNEAKSVIMIFDNGHGMNKDALTSWAKYKLAKNRRTEQDSLLCEVTPEVDEDDDRFLNGQISKFGAGGKESAFYIGRCVRVVTKNKLEDRVYTIELSVKSFAEREKNKEHVYEVDVKHRPPGEEDEDVLPLIKHVAKEEIGQESFTYVIISEINKPQEDKPSHLKTMNDNFRLCARQLSDIYHYYLHGRKGDFTDDVTVKMRQVPKVLRNLNILMKRYSLLKNTDKDYYIRIEVPQEEYNLRDIHDGQQTNYIRKAVNTFEFRGNLDGKKRFGGMIWYYSFKYDKETYPGDVYQQSEENEDDEESSPKYSPEVEGKGSRNLFFTYWNGRLIPYTTLPDMEFTRVPPTNDRKKDTPPVECYNRLAGVLFCDDGFKVTQNKLTFQDNLDSLLLHVSHKDYHPTIEYKDKKNSWTKRGVESGFQAWLNESHKQFDKKIKFLKMEEVMKRTDNGVTKENQYPWTQFKQIEWDKKELKAGSIILINKTIRSHGVGKVLYFTLQGDWTKDYNACNGSEKYVYGSRGWVVVKLLPFDSSEELSFFPLNKVDMTATEAEITVVLNRDREKFPDSLSIVSEQYEREDGSCELVTAVPLKPNQKVPAGTNIGPFKIDILDKTGKSLNGKLNKKNLCIELSVVPEKGSQPLISHICSNFHKKWQFWFREINTITNVGRYKLVIKSSLLKLPNQVDLGITFPSLEIPFEVIPNEAENVVIPPLRGEAVRVGESFDIPITFTDRYQNPITVAPRGFIAIVDSLEKDWHFSVKGTCVRGDRLIANNVVGIGPLVKNKKSVKISVQVRQQKDGTFDGDFDVVKMDIKFRAGHPAALEVTPEGTIEIENGTLPDFGVKIFDVHGNMVTKASEENLVVNVKFFEKVNSSKKYLDGLHLLEIPLNGPDGTPCRLVGGPALQVALTPDIEKKTVYAEITVKRPPESKLIVSSVIRDIVISKCNKPSSMRLYHSSEFDPEIQCELMNEEFLYWTAGEFIRDISFKMFDDTSAEITKPFLTPSNFRISWLTSDWLPPGGYNSSSLKEHKLPDIRAPRTAGEVSSFTVTYYDTSSPAVKSVRDSRADNFFTFSFTVKSLVGPPKSLKVFCGSPDGSNQVPLGEDFPFGILVKLVDKNDNVVQDLPEEDLEKLQIICESTELVTENLQKHLTERGHIEVTGLKFGDNTSLGDVNVSFTFDVNSEETLEGVVILKVVPGLPHKLQWIFDSCEFDSSGTLPCYNKGIVGNWSFQIQDKFGNDVRVKDIPVSIGWHKNLQGATEFGPRTGGQRLLTDTEGHVKFGKVSITTKGDGCLSPCPLSICSGPCYGALKVRARGEFPDNTVILSAGIKIHLMPDPFRPTKFCIRSENMNEEGFLTRDYVVAKGILEFKVQLIAEAENVVKKGNLKNIVMIQICNNDQHKKGSAGCSEVDEESATIFFRPRAPTFAGVYRAWFVYQDDKIGVQLHSQDVVYRVIPDEPIIFGPFEEPMVTSYVSNTSDVNKRLIAKRMKFKLRDIHNNEIPESIKPIKGRCEVNEEKYNGTLVISVEHAEEGDSFIPLPQLDSPNDTIELPIVRGVTEVHAIHLKEKSPGQDMGKYKLIFKPVFKSLKKEIPPYQIPFGFVNEGAKQEKLLAIQMEKRKIIDERFVVDKHRTEIVQHQSALKRDYDHAHETFINFLQDTTRKHAAILPQLSNPGVETTFLKECKSRIIDQSTALNDQEERDQGSNSLHKAPSEPGIVGKIAHLARIENPRENDVISWALRQDMDCIITETFAKATELQKRFGERQQFLSLELARKIQWDDQLPHLRCSAPFNPQGHPFFARHVLHFPPGLEEKCKVAFGGLLTDTIIIDSMQDAMNYRRTLLNQSISCPVIITRDGKRLAATGKFGGLNNSISEEFRKKGVRFAKTPSTQIIQLRSAIHDLTDLIDYSLKRDEMQSQIQRFEKERLPYLKELADRRFLLNERLRELEEQEVETTKKRPASTLAIISRQPPLKKFC